MTLTDPRAELRELVRAVRAHLEALDDSGAEWLPGQLPEFGRPTVSAAGAPRAGAVASSPRSPASPASPAATSSRERHGGETSARAAAPPAGSVAPSAESAPEGSPFDAPASTGIPRAASPAAPPVPRERLSSEERRRRLAVLAEEVAGCTRCPLHATRHRTAFARGNPDAELLFVGEGPGTQEDLQGEPFVGPAGQLLDRMIAAMGMSRDDVYVMNVVKCRPFEAADPRKDRKPTPEEMSACRPFFDRQLELLEPKAMVALGATAVQGLTGVTTGITRLRGTWRLFKGRIPLMPTFHPAYLLRSPEKKREVWEDLQQVMRRLGKEPPKKAR